IPFCALVPSQTTHTDTSPPPSLQSPPAPSPLRAAATSDIEPRSPCAHRSPRANHTPALAAPRAKRIHNLTDVIAKMAEGVKANLRGNDFDLKQKAADP
ncbi:MAG TPA: hypothetical protein VMT73_01255, partial [Anaerolineales bacterium]|nr:hypothetical protein [Anaerolineales bacterium]